MSFLKELKATELDLAVVVCSRFKLSNSNPSPTSTLKGVPAPPINPLDKAVVLISLSVMELVLSDNLVADSY